MCNKPYTFFMLQSIKKVLIALCISNDVVTILISRLWYIFPQVHLHAARNNYNYIMFFCYYSRYSIKWCQDSCSPDNCSQARAQWKYDVLTIDGLSDIIGEQLSGEQLSVIRIKQFHLHSKFQHNYKDIKRLAIKCNCITTPLTTELLVYYNGRLERDLVV